MLSSNLKFTNKRFSLTLCLVLTIFAANITSPAKNQTNAQNAAPTSANTSGYLLVAQSTFASILEFFGFSFGTGEQNQTENKSNDEKDETVKSSSALIVDFENF